MNRLLSGAQFDRLGDRRLGEARPPRARIELGVRAEHLASAAGAPVETVLVLWTYAPVNGRSV
jgi:hypothetical protein